ncbi:MAG: LamG-like jellyroll fold domain-containing protein [Opitutaceae bacterium]
MKSMETSQKRVDYLVERLKDDALSESEIAEIKEIIRDQPNARRRLVELLYVSAGLWDVLNRESSTQEAETPKRSPKLIRFGAAIGLAAAAALAIYLGVTGLNRGSVDRPAPVLAEEEQVQHVAVVTQISDVLWGDDTTLSVNRIKRGLPLGPGVIELDRGLVQIDFYSGASVILEGPAKLALENADLGRLWHGNLRANVPVPARGFRIETDGFDIVDLGTEFGLSVSEDGTSEVHVIDGEVEVHGKEGEVIPEKLLIAGEALALAKDGQRTEKSASPDLFAAAERLNGALRAKYTNWLNFMERMRNDSDLLLGYDFQNHGQVWKRALINVSNYAPRDTNGGIVGSRWIEGRWPEKGALKFRNSSHRVRFKLPGSFEDLTLSTWIRVNKISSSETSILHPETSQDRYVHWTLVAPKAIDSNTLHMHFSVTDKENHGYDDRIHYHNNWNLVRNTSLGAWMHLAVVYDSQAEKVTFYQNGEAVGVSEIESPRLLGVGTADLGNWPYKEWAKGTKFEVQNLNGSMDEFLIFKRALSANEIAEITTYGSP